MTTKAGEQPTITLGVLKAKFASFCTMASRVTDDRISYTVTEWIEQIAEHEPSDFATTSLAAQDVEREPMREYCNEAIYEPKVADSYPRPSLAAQDGLDDELRNALAAAYVAGATDVHNHWAEGDAANNMDPDFGEAGWDYAHSIDVSAIKGDKS